MAKSSPIPFRIKSIETQEFATFKEVYTNEKEVGISTGFNFGMDKTNHLVAVFFNLSFNSKEEDPFVLLKVRIEFDVEPKVFEGFKSKRAKKWILPKDFLIHLSALSLGTARGILHEKISKTEFSHLLLPALNVSEILEEDVEFE